MDAFHFLRPWWLLALLPLLILLPAWRKQLARTRSLKTIVAPHLLAVLSEPSKQQSKSMLWLAATCWIIASLAAAGPSWLKIPVPTYNLDYGRVILMDASLSTRANDVRPDRFEQLKFKAHDLLKQVTDGQTGLIAYAGDAFVVSPLTQDPATIQHMLSALSPEIMPEPGNHPLMAFQQAQQLLSQAGYQMADIIWLTGGIDRTQAEEIQQFIHKQPNPKAYRVSIIAAGTQEGAPVRTRQGELLRDRQGRLIIPKLYPEHLQRIAQSTGGRYFLAQADESDIHSILHDVPKQAHAQQAAFPQGYDDWLDLGPYLALLLLPLLLLLAANLLGIKQRMLSHHKSAHWLLLPAIYSLMMLSYSSPAGADEQGLNGAIAKVFHNNQQRSLTLYQQGKYKEAANATEHPMLSGMAHYRAGEYQQAATHFASLTTAEADFNRGNSLAKAGELKAAIQAYHEALAKRPNWQQAEENKNLVEKLLEQASEQASEESQRDSEHAPDQEQTENKSPQEQTAGQDSEQHDQRQSEQDASEQSQTDTPSEQDAQASTEQHQREGESSTESAESPHADSNQEKDSLPAAWSGLTEEEREQLQSLLKQLDDDPAALLRTRLLREAERRRLQRHY